MTDTHLEIERRFLIRRPEEDTLCALGGVPSRIRQDYLSAPDDVTDRVRARTDAAGTVYTRTVKVRHSDMTREETEVELSESEYRRALLERDPALRTIEKERWCVPFEGKTLEIDLFPFWEDRAVLEVELTDEMEAFCLPETLRLVREITEDRRYSNRALAASIPEEEI